MSKLIALLCLFATSAMAQENQIIPIPGGGLNYLIVPPKGGSTTVLNMPDGSYLVTPPSGASTLIVPVPAGSVMRPLAPKGVNCQVSCQ